MRKGKTGEWFGDWRAVNDVFGDAQGRRFPVLWVNGKEDVAIVQFKSGRIGRRKASSLRKGFLQAT